MTLLKNIPQLKQNIKYKLDPYHFHDYKIIHLYINKKRHSLSIL